VRLRLVLSLRGRRHCSASDRISCHVTARGRRRRRRYRRRNADLRTARTHSALTEPRWRVRAAGTQGAYLYALYKTYDLSMADIGYLFMIGCVPAARRRLLFVSNPCLCFLNVHAGGDDS